MKFTASIRFVTIAAIMMMLSSFALLGDTFGGSHGCFEPSKPFNLNDSFALDRFMDDVKEYRECIADYITEQQEQAQTHLEAAQEAARDWEWFVQRELQ